jgi:hypothetical protein
MKKFLNIPKSTVLVSALILGSLSALAGGNVSGGGDVVFCKASSENKFNGYYTLDYLVTSSNLRSPIVPVVSWAESQARILAQLKRLNPELYMGFKHFLSYQDNYENPAKYRYWNATRLDIVELNDEKLQQKIPKNCVNENSKTEVIQTVVRNAIREYADDKQPFLSVLKVEYLFDEKIVEELINNYPLQYSFLMVHEWLRDYTTDAAVIRSINFLLHSSKLEQLKPSDLSSAQALGLQHRPVLFWGIFKSTDQDNCRLHSFGNSGNDPGEIGINVAIQDDCEAVKRLTKVHEGTPWGHFGGAFGYKLSNCIFSNFRFECSLVGNPDTIVELTDFETITIINPKLKNGKAVFIKE